MASIMATLVSVYRVSACLKGRRLERIAGGKHEYLRLEGDVCGALNTQCIRGDLRFDTGCGECCRQRPFVADAVGDASLQGQADRVFQ